MKDLGWVKNQIITWEKSQRENRENTEMLNAKIKLLQRYRNRIAFIPDGAKTIGQGIYKQKRRSAYKIDTRTSMYGGLFV